MNEGVAAMRNGFLLKTVLLVVALAVVLGIIMYVTQVDFGGATKTSGGRSFFGQFVIAGGPIVWFVLLPMSIVMVYLAVEHSLTIRRSELLPKEVVRSVTKSCDDIVHAREMLDGALEEQASGLLRKIRWLNLIGNVSPMIGLFGTVFGMIKLFDAIVKAGGQPQPAQLAEGISVALVTTFWGLLVAIPALAIHGVFQNRIEGLVSDAAAEAEVVLSQMRRSLKKRPQVEPTKNGPVIQEIAGNQKRQIDESAALR